MGECWGVGIVIFMIFGNICICFCFFCVVKIGCLFEYDEDEFRRVVEVIKLMEVKYVVIILVNCDELKDRGVEIWYQIVCVVKEMSFFIMIEILILDVKVNWEVLERMIEGG